MTDERPEETTGETWEEIARIIAARDAARLESYLGSLPPAEVARAISGKASADFQAGQPVRVLDVEP